MQHRWHKEIKAWADGAEIEMWFPQHGGWGDCIKNPNWLDDVQYRIKPQPKEPQYLYVYADPSWDMSSYKVCRKQGDFGTYIGKIKLEQDNE